MLSFSTTNNTNALLTGSNSWDGSVFTVGTTGAGWYQVDAQIVGIVSGTSTSANVGVLFFMDKNNAVGPSMSGAVYRASYDSVTSATILKNRSALSTLVYLAAGNTLRFRGISFSTSTTANTSVDGSTFLNIVRVK